MSKTYSNYNELIEDNYHLAVELLEEKGEGSWLEEEI